MSAVPSLFHGSLGVTERNVSERAPRPRTPSAGARYHATLLALAGEGLIDVAKCAAVKTLFLGYLGSVAAAAVVVEVMRGDFVLPPGVLALTALLAMGITVSFGFVGTWRALGQRPAPMLRNE